MLSLLTSRVPILLLLLLSINSFAGIGKITEEKGAGEIVRQKNRLDAKVNSGIESMDTIQTVNGVVGITFEDDTKVRVTEHSKLVIDDFVYDPKSKGSGKLAMKVALGTVRYASGAVAKENAKNVAISTPTATVAVRGTAFTMTVDEIGKSLIVLLPNVDGTVGEIEVKTSAGTVVLNQAFQATVTTGSEVKPLKPTLLGLNESAIDNMLIVKPPKEVMQRIVEENTSSSADILANALDYNPLNVKVWFDVLKFDELNMNELDNNYLQNALDTLILNAFQVGYNALTQVYVFDRSSHWQIDRHLRHDFTMLINKERGYDITLIQDGVVLYIKNMDNATNKVTIIQRAN